MNRRVRPGKVPIEGKVLTVSSERLVSRTGFSELVVTVVLVIDLCRNASKTTAGSTAVRDVGHGKGYRSSTNDLTFFKSNC